MSKRRPVTLIDVLSERSVSETMAISVSLIATGSDGNEFDTRDFDSLPRIGETIIFTEAVDMRVTPTHAMSYCTVVDVQHDYRVGYTHPVHAWVTITPRTQDDRDALAKLYPDVDVGAASPDADKG